MFLSVLQGKERTLFLQSFFEGFQTKQNVWNFSSGWRKEIGFWLKFSGQILFDESKNQIICIEKIKCCKFSFSLLFFFLCLSFSFSFFLIFVSSLVEIFVSTKYLFFLFMPNTWHQTWLLVSFSSFAIFSLFFFLLFLLLFLLFYSIQHVYLLFISCLAMGNFFVQIF